MFGHELDAAEISTPAIRAGLFAARRLSTRPGRPTRIQLPIRLLPAAKRPYIYAILGFTRRAQTLPGPAFERWSATVRQELDWGDSSDPLTRAVLATVARWEIPLSYFTDFLESQQSDRLVTGYARYDDLVDYMWGASAVIALQMLLILDRSDIGTRWDVIEPYAIDLGMATQLTTFIRDVGEDLARGHVYLPQESLELFGVDRDRLRRHRVDEPIRNLLAHEIARARGLYARARPGIALLHPTSQDAVRTALRWHCELLAEVERADYDVFTAPVAVGLPRRAGAAAAAVLHAFARARPTPTAWSGSWRNRTTGPR